MAPSNPATKRRRTEVQHAETTEAITNLRSLQSAMADYSGRGLKSFKEFLNRCSKGPEIEESVAAANRTILKEYLEAQTRNAGKEDEDAEKESTVFGDIVQIWSYANQNNSMSSLSMVPTTMTILVRLCSYHDEFKTYGTTLIRTLLRPTTLKIVYRGLTGNKDHIVSPCLRLLTEMNRFNFGAMCGAVHSAFDFTVKDLPRNLEVKGLTKPTVEDPARPSVRTVYLRFILSFLLNGEPSVRNEVLGLRSWTTPIFKHLKTDSAVILHEFLECMTMKVLDEKEIPRATKTNFFNEWTLSHILSLYSREETVMVSKAGKEEEKKVADIAHEFLLNACTKSGAGICFPDHGWYPPGHSDGEEKKKNAPKVHNRILSSLLASIRPYADTMQLDLALGICKTCPELVADHFLSNPTFSFEPKLTSTWIGYCTFLVSVITIPIPENFGAPMALALPPPTSVIVENIIPKPLDKTGLTKCLTNENGLIRFFAIRLLIAAFQKLRSVLDALDTASSAVHDPTESWKKCRFDVVEEFCRRIPDASIVSSIGSGKSDSQGLLQIEAKTRLLADYYTTLPEIASSGRFDINIALGYFLENEDSDQKGMKLLEMGHLLKIANEVPDVKWWNKTSTMKHSPFVAILKRCCSSAANAPQRQVLALLHSFASSSYLFQAETSASPLDALLESLSTIANSENLGAILSFLDEVVARCIRGPFKYLDDYAEIAAGLQNNTSEAAKLSPVSPIVMTLVEQWKFFIQSKDYSSQQKAGGLRWLLRLMESCAILGENRFVLAVLCDRVLDDSGTMKEGIRELKDYLLQDSGLELTSDDDMQEDGVAVGIRDLLTKLRKRCVDVRIAPLLIESVRHRRIEATVFDVTVVQRAIVDIVKCSSNNSADAVSAIIKLTELTKYMTFQLISQGNKSVEKTKAFIAKESPCLHAFLTTPVTAGKLPEIAALSHGYAELLSVIFEKDDPILESARQLLSGRLVTFIRELSSLSEENLPKILFAYRTVLTLLHTPEDVSRLVECLSNEPAPGSDRMLSRLVAFILHLSVERGVIIDAAFINTLLQAGSMASRVSSALMAYISTAESEDLQGICYPRTEQAEHLAVVCALIPKSPAVRDAALTAVDKAVSSDTLMLSERISALLEAYSEENDDSMGFAWSPSAGETVRAKLQRVFNTAQPILLESASDASQVNVLRRAASLFPTLDREQALQHVAKNRKRSTLTENTIALIDALVEDSDDASTPEMKGWFLMAFDHLTRRFAEDAVLAPKVTTFAKALGKFLARREVTLDKLVPRSTLNAALEAGLQKHIAIPEVVCFATNVVVLSSPKSLDLAKLLQIVLGHPENPLAFLDTIYEPQDIQHYLAFLILKLFQAGKAALCNIATLDGVMALYRGTNNFIDGVLLKIITRVEGHLTRSCASRVSSWSVLGSTEKPLISRVRGRLEVAINGKMLAKSVFHFIPTSIAAEEEDFDTLDSYLQAIKDNTLPVGKAYDPRFLLPALTFCVFSDAQILDAQAAVERHCLAYALTGLSSTSAAIRSMAIGFLNALASKLEDSAYRGKTQLNHLVLSILASLQTSPQEPLPAAMSIFLAQASQVLANPTHFLYEKVMQLLLRSPLLQLHDIPLMLSTAHVDGNENAHKEVAWILNVLSAGIKSPQDLLLYRKRNVFGNVLALYASPNATERTREKVVELLWNAAAVEGAGTTLITRNGVVAWIEQQLGTQLDGGVELKRLLARLWEGAHKTHVKEWSRGAVGAHFVAAVV